MYKMILKVFLLLNWAYITRCSFVVDSAYQNSMSVSDYCRNTDICPNGTHTMCLYNNPDQDVYTRCGQKENTTITPDLANLMLEINNAIRSRVALGMETGRNGVPLPRAYGLFRLKWDSELATIAQVWADQCKFVKDSCRGTKKFRNPTQSVSINYFYFNDWNPTVKVAKLEPGLTDAKLTYGITASFKRFYTNKNNVNEDLVATEDPNTYLPIVNGQLTHMGCGLTAYAQSIQSSSKAFHSILVVCNYSHEMKSKAVYSTTRDPGTSLCGCPEGTLEDSDCLCNVVPPPNDKPCPDPGGADSEPTLVLLPIITVEDAPPSMIADRTEDIQEPLNNLFKKLYDNRPNSRKTDTARNDFIADIQKSDPSQPQQHNLISHSLYSMERYSSKTPIRPPKQNLVSSLPSDSKPNKVAPSPRSYERNGQSKGYPRSQKSSIFNKAQFKLPAKGSKSVPFKPIKADVKPRKDFTNIQHVVNNYIKQRDSKFRRSHDVANKYADKLRKGTKRTTPKLEEYTETALNKVEENVINFDQFEQRSNISVEDNTKHFDINYEENDNKLMALLDTLEREVKHVELFGTKREIFDAKIRKIYDSVVGKPKTVKTSNFQPNSKVPTQNKLKHQSQSPDFLDNDFEESKAYVKHESNHITESYNEDFLIHHETDHLYGENSGYHARDFDYVDNKYNDKFDRPQIPKEEDIKINYDSDILNQNEHRLFSDPENKYDHHIALNPIDKLDEKYPIDEKYHDMSGHIEHNVLSSHTFNNIPTSLNRKNIGNNVNLNPGVTSEEARSRRDFDKYQEKESIRNTRTSMDRNYLTNNEVNRKHGVEDRKRGKESFLENDIGLNEPLSAERRKYYQNKLDHLQRGLRDRSIRPNSKYDSRPNERTYRRMRPNREETDRQRSKMQGDSFYMPDRARFLHGF